MKIITLIAMLTFSFSAQSGQKSKDKSFLLHMSNGHPLKVMEKDGNLIFEDSKDRPTLIIVFGYQCTPCLKEIPIFIKVFKKYHKKVFLIAVEAQGYQLKYLKNFIKKYDINYPVIAGINHNEFISYLLKKVGHPSIIPLPLLISVTKTGRIQKVTIGAVSADQVQRIITSLLAASRSSQKVFGPAEKAPRG